MENEIMNYIALVITWVTALVGAASLIVAGLEKIAKLTPTDKDDAAISTAKRWLAWIIAILDRLALNPDKNSAREPKGPDANS